MSLRFGLQLTAVHDAGTPAAQQLREHEELARTAAAAGFDFVAAGQHYLTTELRFYQPVPYLAHLAHVVPGMRVAIAILLLPLHNPVEVAEQVATLDAISGGRVILGVGLGYADHEFAAFGVERRHRVGRFEESIAVIRALWSGEAARHHGPHFDIDPLATAALPMQRPGPPLWIAGQSSSAVRRAARLGDGWLAPPFPTHDELGHLVDEFREERELAGRPAADLPLRRDIVIAPGRERALEGARERVAGRFGTYLRWGLGRDLAAGDFDSTAPDSLRSRFLLGTPRDVATQIDELHARTGMTHLELKPQWPALDHREAMEQLELFASRVVPLIRRVSADA